MITTDPTNPELRETDPVTGLQKSYLVLSEEERSKGFTRPYRDTYVHVGKKPKYPLRDLTPDEHERYDKFGYAVFEAYPVDGSGILGTFWTQAQLDAKPCGAVTTMGRALSETYARDPRFYGATYCCACRGHFPVAEFVWDVDGQVVGS